jgi:hypothetical protein
VVEKKQKNKKVLEKQKTIKNKKVVLHIGQVVKEEV